MHSWMEHGLRYLVRHIVLCWLLHGAYHRCIHTHILVLGVWLHSCACSCFNNGTYQMLYVRCCWFVTRCSLTSRFARSAHHSQRSLTVCFVVQLVRLCWHHHQTACTSMRLEETNHRKIAYLPTFDSCDAFFGDVVLNVSWMIISLSIAAADCSRNSSRTNCSLCHLRSNCSKRSSSSSSSYSSSDSSL